MILAEQLVLVALDPERGKLATGIVPERLRTGAAAALLAELVLHRRLVAMPTGVAVDDRLPDFHPLLAETSRVLGGHAYADAADALKRLDRSSGSLVKRLIGNLVGRDILHDYREAFLFHRHPVRSMQALREVLASIQSVSKGDSHAPAALALAAIADASGVFAARFTAEERMKTRRRIDDESRRAMVGGDPSGDVGLIMELARATVEAHA